MSKNNRKSGGHGRVNSGSRGRDYQSRKEVGVLEFPGYSPLFPNVVYQSTRQIPPQRNLVTKKFEEVVDLLRIFRYTTPTQDELKRELSCNIEEPNKEKLEILMTFGKSKIDFPYRQEFLQLTLERVGLKGLQTLKSLSNGAFDLDKYEALLSSQKTIFGHIVCFGFNIPIREGKISTLSEIEGDLAKEIISGRHYSISQDSPLNNRDDAFKEIKTLSRHLQDKDKLRDTLDITPRIVKLMVQDILLGYMAWRQKIEFMKARNESSPLMCYEPPVNSRMIRNPDRKNKGKRLN